MAFPPRPPPPPAAALPGGQPVRCAPAPIAPRAWLATSTGPWMVMERGNRASGVGPWAETTTPAGMTIWPATTTQTSLLPPEGLPLETRTQVRPWSGVDAPVSVLNDALSAIRTTVSRGVAHAMAWNSGVPSAIDAQIGERSTAAPSGSKLPASDMFALPASDMLAFELLSHMSSALQRNPLGHAPSGPHARRP